MKGLSILAELGAWFEVNPNRYVAYNRMVGEGSLKLSPYQFRKLVKELIDLGLVERYRHEYRLTMKGYDVVIAIWGGK